MLRRPTFAMLAPLTLVLFGGLAAAAQSPEPAPVGVEGRVELSDHGFAVTLPDNWGWVRPSEDAERFRDRLEDVMDPDRASRYIEWAGMLAEPMVLMADPVEPSSETFGILAMSLGGIPLDEFVERQVALYDLQEELWPGEPTVTWVALPAGEAARMDYTRVISGRSFDSSTYWLTDEAGDMLYELTFWGPDRPEDDWRSIAGTFEFLSVGRADPAGASVSQAPPVGLGGRVEVPAHGFAVTFPDDWVWVRESQLDAETVAGMLEAIAGPDISSALRSDLDAGGSPLLGVPAGEDVDPLESCYFVVVMRGPDGEAWVTDYIGSYKAMGDSYPGGLVVTDVALPAGDAARLDMSRTAAGEVIPDTSVYLLSSDVGHALFVCSALDPPADRWLSIAETFEFLPEEG